MLLCSTVVRVCVVFTRIRAVKHAQGKKGLVWLPHPKPDDPIGDALRSAFPKEANETMPGELKALLFILKALSDPVPQTEPEKGAVEAELTA
jgi:hypothetical protein